MARKDGTGVFRAAPAWRLGIVRRAGAGASGSARVFRRCWSVLQWSWFVLHQRERAARAGAALGRVRRSGLRPDCAAVLGSGAPPYIDRSAPCGRTPNRHGESEVDARLRRAAPDPAVLAASQGPAQRLPDPLAETRVVILQTPLQPPRGVASRRHGVTPGLDAKRRSLCLLADHHHWFSPVVGRPLWACLRGAAQHRRNGRRAAGAHPQHTRRTCSQCACKAHGDKCTARPVLRCWAGSRRTAPTAEPASPQRPARRRAAPI